MSPWRRTDGWTFNGNLIFGIYWNEYRATQSVDNVRLSFAILVGMSEVEETATRRIPIQMCQSISFSAPCHFLFSVQCQQFARIKKYGF